MMIFEILTIFPELLSSPLQEGIVYQALQKEQIDVRMTNIREFANDKHQMTDDRPFGGGEGMVMKAGPLARATETVCGKASDTKPPVILLSPQGEKLNQDLVKELATFPKLVFVCGRYEGVDARYINKYVDREISIGDYIISGGELGAMILIDSITRVLPGVLGCSDSVTRDSFERNLLKHPQYTRPREFEGDSVPDVLLSGDHGAIAEHRLIESVKTTITKRPSLIKSVRLNKSEIKLLKKIGLYEKIKQIQGEGS